jgi:hypothetical protein
MPDPDIAFTRQDDSPQIVQSFLVLDGKAAAFGPPPLTAAQRGICGVVAVMAVYRVLVFFPLAAVVAGMNASKSMATRPYNVHRRLRRMSILLMAASGHSQMRQVYDQKSTA